MFDLAQRVALLTGANGGIGRAITRQFTEFGARVVMADINVDGAMEFASALHGAQSSVAVTKLNADASDDVDQAIRFALDRFDRLDFLVTAAAIYDDQPFETMTDDQWRYTLTTNLDSVYLCMPARDSCYGGRLGNCESRL
jgi:3-oxoacyl-[acyl-carrier protein] reductase